MIQVWTSHEWYGHQVSTLSVNVDLDKKKLFVVLLKEWYHKCLLKNCYAFPLWWVGFNQHLSQQSTFSSPSQHFLAILLSLLPFTRNLPSMRRPNSCIVVWQQLICWLVLLLSLSLLHMGFRGSRILDSLSLRRGSSLHHRLSIMWNFSVDDGGNNRGQTFRPVVGAEMQRVCNFEECLYHHS